MDRAKKKRVLAEGQNSFLFCPIQFYHPMIVIQEESFRLKNISLRSEIFVFQFDIKAISFQFRFNCVLFTFQPFRIYGPEPPCCGFL